MDFDYTDEQRQLSDTLARYIAKEYGFDRRQAIARSAPGMSDAHWKAFAELGLLALAVPEAHGGLGGTAVDTMIAMEALGRGLVLEPYLATAVVCARLVADVGSDAQKADILPAIAAGERVLAFAHHEQGARYELAHCATAARGEGAHYVIDGAKSVVLAGPQAAQLIVSARTAGATRDETGLSLFVVDPAAAGVSIRGYPTQDGARAAEIGFAGVRVPAAALLGSEDDAFPAIERAIDYGIAALCGEAVGVMAALNEATLEYLKTREQFGGPIGRFQALQHRIVDMFIATEQARSMAIMASVGVEADDRRARRRAVSMAKALVGQSARLVGQQAVQLHGGMGVTCELIVSHHFKRLASINATWGDADHHLAQVSDALLAA
jgi:alkylation response protein AidB-like acyl-CoA dehydrogenase